MQHQISADQVVRPVPSARPYRVKQVAELLDVHPATVYRAIESGRLAALRVGSGRGGLRIPREAFAAFVASISTATDVTVSEVA